MTWHAPRGSTVLSGSEAKLIAETIDGIIADIQIDGGDEDSKLYCGPALFNRMTITQQAASLELVTNALFKETIEPLPLVAWSEATLAAILRCLQDAICYEIDTGESSEIRNEIDRLTGSEVSPKKEDWDSQEQWELPFECYQSQFLWDYDFEDTALPDLDPETSQRIRSELNIEDDYHSIAPPDLKSDQNLDDCLKRIRDIIRQY